ncbi:MAG: hypothetical protein NC908_04240 [Candidatus Omnitrophica bacterium]|nr:hypothetical protein [Candidatus Omnitrophota bacterium]
MKRYNFAPQKGETLTITGSKLTTGQGVVLLAAEIKAGDQVIKLRDAQGQPLWRQQGPGGPRR